MQAEETVDRVKLKQIDSEHSVPSNFQKRKRKGKIHQMAAYLGPAFIVSVTPGILQQI